MRLDGNEKSAAIAAKATPRPSPALPIFFIVFPRPQFQRLALKHDFGDLVQLRFRC